MRLALTPRCTAPLLLLVLALGSPLVHAQAIDVPLRAVDAVAAHVRAQAVTRGIDPADVADLVLSDGHVGASGVAYVYLRQRLDGLDVTGSQISAAVSPDGRVLHATGDLVAHLDALAGTRRSTVLSPAAALRAAAGYVNVDLGAVTPETALRLGQPRFDAAGLASPATLREVYHRASDGTLARAWEVFLDGRLASDMWLVTVSAATGAELERRSLTVHEHAESLVPSGAPRSLAPVRPSPFGTAPFADAASALVGSYRVYPVPVESPIHTTPLPPSDGRTTIANPDNAAASPFGWHDTNGAAGAEFTITRGNNVHAYTDTDANNTPDAGSSPDGGASLSFVFPLDLTQAPSAYRPAAVTNLFYWNNVIHDVLYQYGFTSAAGNFRVNTYGGGGLGNDDVQAEAQDGSGTNNANFSTPADGQRPRMQMYLWTAPTPDRDGDFDNGIIVHEYGHGISNRLTGGPSNVSCLGNAEQMGEGWSDWYGLMLTMRSTDTATQSRGIGTYALDQPTTGVGIRPAPYSTSFALNNYTYQRTRTLAVPHGVGFVWATILWEATWEMIAAHGFSADLYNGNGTAGNQKMLRLVTEAMKLQPCNPGFVSGRDAILAVDAALYPDAANPGRGLHYATLWSAFARRGLGFSATQGSTTSNADNTEAFDTPLPAAAATITPGSLNALLAPGGTSGTSVQIANTAAPGSQSLSYTASLQNMTFVPSARSAAPAATAEPVVSGEITIHAGAPADAKGMAAERAATTTSTVPSPDALMGAGGPDAFGYRWDDSNEPGGPVVAFQDISATGTPITTWTATGTFDPRDEGYADVALPFAFPYYGSTRTSVRINTNGFLHFSTHAADAFTNLAVPATSAPNSVIAPFWDDLNMAQASGGTVYTGTLPDGRFVVQFNAVKGFNQASSSFTFQVLLSASGVIEVQYGTMTGTLTSATVGIENDAGTVGLAVAFNAAYVASNRALRFRAGRQWVAVTNASGSLAPGASGTIGLNFNATGLTEGTYTADLVITSNAPGSPATFPVSLTVGGQGVVAGTAGWRLLAAPATGLTVDALAAMNLVQGVPGYYPPPQAQPNLLTGYNGTSFSSGGTGTVLPPGRGFFWYFYNTNLTPGGPSNSYALPTTLATTNTPVTTDTPVALHGSGSRYNLLGNPFGTSLNLAAMGTWPGASALASTVAQTWDAASSSYETSVTLPVIAPWQGFWVEATPAAGTLTIPASARTTGGVLQRTGDDAAALLAFELSEAQGDHRDRAAVIVFGESFSDDRDAGDAPKLTPISSSHVLLAIGENDALWSVDSRPMAAVSLPMAVASVGASSDLVLRWPRIEGLPDTWTARLTDLETGQIVDLATTDSYAFHVTPTAARAALAPEGVFASVLPARFTVTVGPSGVVGLEGGAPAALALDLVRPNPATDRATIRYHLPAAGPLRLTVVDLLGREVATLAEGTGLAGSHTVVWDVSRLALGVYTVRLVAGEATLVQRVTVVR